MDAPAYTVTLPRYVAVTFACALLTNAFATALLATALILHLGGRWA